MRREPTSLLLLPGALLALALLPSAAAIPESQAPATNPWVLSASHDPEAIVPGEQWHGVLQLRAGHPYQRVGYQVCNAGDGYCFAPTHDATHVGNGTYRFDTADYLASNGQPVAWEAGWTIGVRWFLADGVEPGANGTWVPRAPPSPTETVPIPDLYLTFDVPGEAGHGAPAPGFLLLLVGLAAALLVARRR